ncbi:MAG: hypothetical protein A2X22_06050 [Bacteroidetes bacterium GWF2_49_14]|nr:MAG: hypothetical protein A2X22_06050 [Bacteroidetes bacterium GWF2_49_14]
MQKYYDGWSTPEEELLLESYFLNGRPDREFAADEQYFRDMKEIRLAEIPVPEDLEQSVLNRLESIQGQSAGSSHRLLYLVMSSAASVLILISSILFLNRRDLVNELSDPQLAYSESLSALEKVSGYLNQGTSGLSDLSALSDAVEPLKKLNSIHRATQELSVLSKLGNALTATHEFAKEK